MAVIELSSVMERMLVKCLEKFGLRPSRFHLLAVLASASRAGVTPSHLATALGLTNGTISGLLALLERDGLVTRDLCLSDRRSLTVRCTPVGQALLERAAKEYLAVLAELSGSVGALEAGCVAAVRRIAFRNAAAARPELTLESPALS